MRRGREGGEGEREGGRERERERERAASTSAAGLTYGHFEKFGLISDKKKVWTYIWYI